MGTGLDALRRIGDVIDGGDALGAGGDRLAFEGKVQQRVRIKLL
jgi:hypothetical protein